MRRRESKEKHEQLNSQMHLSGSDPNHFQRVAQACFLVYLQLTGQAPLTCSSGVRQPGSGEPTWHFQLVLALT